MCEPFTDELKQRKFAEGAMLSSNGCVNSLSGLGVCTPSRMSSRIWQIARCDIAMQNMMSMEFTLSQDGMSPIGSITPTTSTFFHTGTTLSDGSSFLMTSFLAYSWEHSDKVFKS